MGQKKTQNKYMVGTGAQYGLFSICRMMSTESANSFTLIGEASDSMENLSRRLKVVSVFALKH